MRFAALALLSCLLLSGCRGGGSSAAIPPVSAGTASFSISVPPAANGAPLSIQSLSVSLDTVDGREPAAAPRPFEMNLSKASAGCTALIDGSLTCTAKISVPPGNDSFTVTAFALPNEAGARVYSNRVTTHITAGRSTTCVKRS